MIGTVGFMGGMFEHFAGLARTVASLLSCIMICSTCVGGSCNVAT